MVKILDVMIKTIDDKGHVKTLSKDDIELDSIVIIPKQEPKPTPPPVKEPKVEEAPPKKKDTVVEKLDLSIEPEKPKKTRTRKPKKP